MSETETFDDAASAAHPDADLIALSKKLRELENQRLNLDDGERFDVIYEQHWAVRKEINGIRAQTFEGLRVKARAAEIALRDDNDIENMGEGSFAKLAASLIDDLLSIRNADV